MRYDVVRSSRPRPAGRRRARLVLLAGAALLVTVACGSRGSDDAAAVIETPDVPVETVDASPEPPEPTEPPEPPEPPAPAYEPEHQYDVRLEDAQGFVLQADIRVGDAIRGTRTADMEARWAAVGGEGPVPCQDAEIENDMSTLVAVHTQTSAYAFGTLMINSATDGFDPPSTLWQFTTGRAAPEQGELVGSLGGIKAMGVGFSDGPRCDGLTGGGFLMTPTMDGPFWGPVAVVFAFDGAFTPRHPDGDPAVVEDYLIRVADLAGAEMLDPDGRSVPGMQIRLER